MNTCTPNSKIVDLIKRRMNGWDGMPGPVNSRPQNRMEWASAMYEWGRRVRRDILVIEHHLTTHLNVASDDLYGDPGDPPPPPDNFQ